MITYPFQYKRASSVAEAVAMLAEGGKALSGGHSLIPSMKLRLNAPDTLVDIGRIAELKQIALDGSELVIGAGETHGQIAESGLVKEHASLFAQGAAHIGDPAVRQRGTIGGSLAHADPSADWPALVLAANATIVMTGPGGNRSVLATDFFTGLFSTALNDDELITQIRVPVSAGSKSVYEKFAQPASRYAIVGCAVVKSADGNISVAFSGVSEAPVPGHQRRKQPEQRTGSRPSRPRTLDHVGQLRVGNVSATLSQRVPETGLGRPGVTQLQVIRWVQALQPGSLMAFSLPSFSRGEYIAYPGGVLRQ